MNKKRSIEFYDQYVQRQVKMGINHRHISIVQLLEKFGLQSTDEVLEIGCGVGTVTGLIAAHVKKGRIVANDISRKSIDAAEEILRDRKNIQFIAGDIIKEELEGTFDWIVLPDVLEHIPIEHHQALFDKLKVHLKPNGRILIHIPQEDYLRWIHEHQPELLQEIDQPLDLIEIVRKLKISQLHLLQLKDYSIYVKPYDYRYLLITHQFKGKFVSSGIKQHSVLDKIKFKLKY